MKTRNAVAFHDQLADTWEQRYKTPQFSLRLRVLAEVLPEPQHGLTWLDAGCGTGTIARWLARERGARVIAMDASERMLENAAKSPNVEYIIGDITCSSLRGNSFDGIVCSSVLEYLLDPIEALREFQRIAKPGATILLSVPNAALCVQAILRTGYWMTRLFRKRRVFSYLDHSKHRFNEQDFARLLSANGFASFVTRPFGKIRLPFGIDATSSGTLLMFRCRKC